MKLADPQDTKVIVDTTISKSYMLELILYSKIYVYIFYLNIKSLFSLTKIYYVDSHPENYLYYSENMRIRLLIYSIILLILFRFYKLGIQHIHFLCIVDMSLNNLSLN